MMGAVQHRGSILTLLDLAPFWGVELRAWRDLPTFIVVGDGRAQIGLLWRSWWGCTRWTPPIQPYRGDERVGPSRRSPTGGRSRCWSSPPRACCRTGWLKVS